MSTPGPFTALGSLRAPERKPTWMQTYSGRPFYPLDATEDDIEIVDIAHALGMVCRYAGHVRRFYSVAEHCVHLSHTVDPEHALAALLHDAAEAYVGDMVRPLKHELPGYMAVEDHLIAVINNKYGLPGELPAQVKEHDTRIVVDEREQLMTPSQLPWSMLDGFAPLGVEVQGWNPIVAEEMYLHRFYQLTVN